MVNLVCYCHLTNACVLSYCSYYYCVGMKKNCSFSVEIPLEQKLPVRRCDDDVRRYTLKIIKSSLPSGVYQIESKSAHVIEYW